MTARTVLLAKKAEPRGFQDSRPIAILSVFGRMATKIVADQPLKQWSNTFPLNISGGLPRRGARDQSFIQQIDLEDSKRKQEPVYGFTLDLTKPFNMFARHPLGVVLRKLRIPPEATEWWLQSLTRLVKTAYGPPIPATTGVPEGD